MTREHAGRESLPLTELAVARWGFWISIATGVLTLSTFIIAVATPPLSGPLCAGDCFQYPFLDTNTRFPRDFYWMFPAIAATLLFVAFVIALNARAAPGRRIIGQFSTVLAAMAGLTLVADYFLQLAVIQPSLLAKEADGISLLSQFNPHGVFIALEELGFLLMVLSLACVGIALPGSSRMERNVSRFFVGGAGVALLTLLGVLLLYGHAREYRFEIAIISIGWCVLIVGAFMMAAVFRREAALPR
jgi:hypothetical protein